MLKFTSIIVFCLLVLPFVSSLSCDLKGKQENLVDCLDQLDPSITELSIYDYTGYYFDISPLAIQLPKNTQLEQISFKITNIQSYLPYEVCFKGLVNLKSVNLDFTMVKSQSPQFKDLQFLVTMFQDQKDSLLDLVLYLGDLPYDDITPINKLFRHLVFLKNIDIKMGKQFQKVNYGGLMGLFKYNFQLDSLIFKLYNTDWDGSNISGLRYLFLGVSRLRTLKLHFQYNKLQDYSVFEDTFIPISYNLINLELDLTNNNNDYSPFKTVLWKMTNLKKLDFNLNDEISPEGFQTLGTIFQVLPAVEIINFNIVGFIAYNLKFEYFQNAFNCPTLQKLNLNFVLAHKLSISDLAYLSDGLQQIQELSINFGKGKLEGQDLAVFNEFLSKMPQLQKLSILLYENYIGDISFMQNSLQNLTELKDYTLDLTYQKDISTVEKMKNVKALSKMFENNTKLEIVDLQFVNNYIQSLKPLKTAFQNQKSLTSFVGNFSRNCLHQSEEFYNSEFSKIYPNVKHVSIEINVGGFPMKDQCTKPNLRTQQIQ